MRASFTAAADTTTSWSATAATNGAIPAVVRNDPSRPSSAMNATLCTASAGITPVATNNPTAMATSRPAPPRRSPAPAKLMVIRRFGHSRPLDNMAARTRSRDSRQPSSGRPTTVNAGMPGPTCDSTTMRDPDVPVSVADVIAANMCSLPWAHF